MAGIEEISRNVMISTQRSQTDFYNGVNDPGVTTGPEASVRELVADLDIAVARHLGLETRPTHDFVPGRMGVRFSIAQTSWSPIRAELVAANQRISESRSR